METFPKPYNITAKNDKIHQPGRILLIQHTDPTHKHRATIAYVVSRLHALFIG